LQYDQKTVSAMAEAVSLYKLTSLTGFLFYAIFVTL